MSHPRLSPAAQPPLPHRTVPRGGAAPPAPPPVWCWSTWHSACFWLAAISPARLPPAGSAAPLAVIHRNALRFCSYDRSFKGASLLSRHRGASAERRDHGPAQPPSLPRGQWLCPTTVILMALHLIHAINHFACSAVLYRRLLERCFTHHLPFTSWLF